MGAFMEEATKSGALIETGGFAPSALGAKVALADGKFSVTDGPFSEAKELIGGWALCELSSKEEAIDYAKRFLKIVGGGESRIRQVFGPEDGAPRWPDPTLIAPSTPSGGSSRPGSLPG